MTAVPASADVVVIGGGPAGSMAATALAQQGFHTLLLEKARHPRPTVGESLIPHFWKYMDIMGATEAVEREQFLAKGGGLALWQGKLRQLNFKDFGYTKPALHVERDVFDNILLGAAEAAGVEVHQETPVTEVAGDLEAPVIRYRAPDGAMGEVKTRFVVDASGQSALLAKQLGIREFDTDLRFVALWGYYQGGSYLTVDGAVHPYEQRREVAPATVTSTIGDWGWIWHIVMRDHVSVGVVLPPERLQEFKAAKDTKEAKFQGLVAGSPLVGDLLRDATFTGEMYGIRDYAYKPVKLAEGHCYMAGDAAAFVDPINSAGVVFALYAGYASAFSIGQSLHHPHRKDDFRRRYCELYGERLELFRMLALPSDREGVERAREAAKKTVSMTSASEQQIMLLTATLNSRAEAITEVLEQLGVPSEVARCTVPIPEVPLTVRASS